MEEVELITFEGFYKYWFKLIKDMSHEDAYYCTVEKYEQLYRVKFKRWKNFESFRVAKTQYFNRNGRI